ncbi:hypothetical protein COLO4_29552 [Corchorus olitorius]|uniref:Legume lectin domain-containing protein n=1 Tax=Corchorus olitorius TaxID=93759 RepID=A0A1R3HE40_9ROSI|nr:hypothetical protein COLO4_29552 [Corchorus olitorius]
MADEYKFDRLRVTTWETDLICLIIDQVSLLAYLESFIIITSFDANANNIIYEGDAKPSLGSIELNTIDYSCRVGRALYYEPIRLWDSSTMKVADFSTHFSFTINTRNITPYGNGFAFFLAPVTHQIPLNSMGGYLGLLNSTSSTNSAASQNHIITVEFDSYVNPDWDPPTEHVGINNNSMRSAVYVPWNAGMYSNLVANVWITYNATATNLSVFWTYDEHPVFEGNSSLSYKIDLMKHLPEWVKIGFSAATGQYAEYNTINSWEFTSNLDGSNGRRRNRKTYVFLLVAACSVALVFGLAMAAWLLMKRTKPEPCKDDDHPSGSDRVQPLLPIVFPYQELYAATNGFAVDRRMVSRK